MSVWILIIWMGIDRGGGVATAEFTTKERCEAAAKAVWETPKYAQMTAYHIGNHVCVAK